MAQPRVKSKNELIVIGKVHLVEYYNSQIVPLHKKYRPMSEEKNTGLCPFHEDTDPSLHYWKKNGIFHCFGCGFGGDVVRTHMRLRIQHFGEKISIEVAVQQLATIFGVELDHEEGFVVQSPFERARALLLEKSAYSIPKGSMSLSEFRKLNSRVRDSSFTQRIKIDNFENLDLMASVALTND